jgi:hypothetical protein
MTASGARLAVRDLLLRRQVWVWLLPVLLFLAVRKEDKDVTKALEGLLGLAAIVLVARHRARAVVALVVLLPFSTLILAGLLRLGVPAFAVKGLRLWKELLAAGLAVAALRQLQVRRRVVGRLRFDALDKVAFAYAGLGLAYMLFPGILAGGTVGAHLSFYARELGWRGDLLYVVLFLVVRHLDLSRSDVERLFRRFVATAVVMALAGVYEAFATRSWLHLLNRVLRVPVYNARVLGSSSPQVTEVYGSATGGHLPRIGSVLLDYLGTGFFLMIAFAVVIAMVSQRKQPAWVLAAIPVITLGLILNQGRAPAAGAAVALIVTFGSRLRRSVARRVRFSLAAAILAVGAIPLVISSGLAHRFVSSHKSNAGHVSQTTLGLQALGSHPLGRGLATAAGAGQQAADKGLIDPSVFLISEDQWLQIGTQLGLPGLALYVATLLLLTFRLTPRRPGHRALDGDELALAARNALIALMVGGFFLQTFINDQVDWPFFILCGAAVSLLDRPPAARAVNLTPVEVREVLG